MAGSKLLAGILGILLIFGFVLIGCDNGGGDPVWLADLQNPFIGKWEADIPSAQMHLIFDYKTDGSFDFEIPGLPADQGRGKGGYLVAGNVMVSYLDFEGAAGYTFKVVDNDTIDVTEIERINGDGNFVLGETAPFTRVAGSPVNRENAPFVLNHPYLGKWEFKAENTVIPELGPDEHNIATTYEAGADGILKYDFELDDNPPVLAAIPYFIFENTLVVYDPAEGIEAAQITPAEHDPDIIYLTDESGQPMPLTRIP
ncbi:MAG: hypothetical protein LBH51_01265 [Treponema sp.]|jgi:hypothetical protein|nr:hypothetical protein [Treponema sp.]